MITSGSFKKGWIVDVGPAVKGKPASGAGRRTTLDIGPYIDWERGMKHPEVTMSDTPPNSNLIAYRKAIEAAGLAIDLAKRVTDLSTGSPGRRLPLVLLLTPALSLPLSSPEPGSRHSAPARGAR